MRILIFSFLLLGFINANAQKNISNSQLLDFYGDAMMNSYQQKNRQFAFDNFYPLLKETLNSSYEKSLDTITGINIIAPEDNSFKLYSWQLELNENDIKYYAFLITNQGKVYEFTQNNDDLGVDFSYYVHSPTDWYGAIYYKIREEVVEGKKQYIIQGFKKINKFTKAKIVEVLHFDETGEPLFGKEIFHMTVKDSRDDIFTKLIMTYDGKAFVDYTYDPNSKRIVFDHLVSKMGSLPGQGWTKYPDGTYEGYENRSGIYYYIEKMYDKINERPLYDGKKHKKSRLFEKKK